MVGCECMDVAVVNWSIHDVWLLNLIKLYVKRDCDTSLKLKKNNIIGYACPSGIISTSEAYLIWK